MIEWKLIETRVSTVCSRIFVIECAIEMLIPASYAL